MARDGAPVRACNVQARGRIRGWAQAERGDGAGRMAGPGSGSRPGFRAAAAPAAARKQRRQQVKPPQQQQPGGTVDALIAAPVAPVAAPVAFIAQVAAPVALDAPVAAPAASVHAPVAVVAPAATPVDAQTMSLIQFVSAMHSEHSAKIQDVRSQLQLQEKDFQRQLQLQNKQQLQLRQQLQN